MTTRPVVIVAGGDAVALSVVAHLPPDAFVIAADSGLHSALDLGLTIDLVVGDLDSADPEAVGRAAGSGAAIERHPTDKDATDLEIALDAAVARDLSPAVVLGGASFDRIDHFLANALLLAAERFRQLRIRWLIKSAEIQVVDDNVVIDGEVGDTLTLLPVGGPAEGVQTRGLAWPLDGETLVPGSTRGVSNVLVQPRAHIGVAAGVLLVIHGGPA